MELFVQYENYCTHDYREPVEYGEWEEDWEFYPRGVVASSRGQWSGLAHSEEKFNVSFEAKPGDTLHVLYMIYSQGDSFGRGRGYNEIIWVFKDLDVARRAQKDILDKQEAFTISFTDDAGNKIEFSNPGAGYFEYVQRIEIESFELQP